ncbi:MAG: hypothetical protein ABEI57_00455 [Halapricum sp.]
MPDLMVSPSLYRQLESEADEGEIETVLWEMVGTYRRQNNPEAVPTE